SFSPRRAARHPVPLDTVRACVHSLWALLLPGGRSSSIAAATSTHSTSTIVAPKGHGTSTTAATSSHGTSTTASPDGRGKPSATAVVNGHAASATSAAAPEAVAMTQPPPTDAVAPATSAQPHGSKAHGVKPAVGHAPSTLPTDTKASGTKGGSSSPPHSAMASVAPAHASAFAHMPTLLLVRLAAATATLAHYGPQAMGTGRLPKKGTRHPFPSSSTVPASDWQPPQEGTAAMCSQLLLRWSSLSTAQKHTSMAAIKLLQSMYAQQRQENG
ncbi:hypothetical protein DUNSADRAFT_17489, partial [Dunaliella salina]